MDALRRLRRPPGNRLKNRPHSNRRLGLASLRGQERRLSEGLEQLRRGVPLNWTQVEDDPELATLAYLQEVAAEERERDLSNIPATLRQSILDDLSARLPRPRHVQAKVAPKTLAGFSENVTIMTQAEESVPELISRAPQIAGAIALAIGVVALLWWGISTLQAQSASPVPVYSWIQVTQGDKALSRVQKTQATLPTCRDYNFADPEARRTFVSIPDTKQIQSNVGFPIEFLPQALGASDPPTSTEAYAVHLSDMSVATCEQELSPDDSGASVRIEYTATLGLAESASGSSPLHTFQIRKHPTTLDVGTGTWKEVLIGKAHGVYWRGSSYRDLADTQWTGDVSVMLVERDDSVLTLVGQTSLALSEAFLSEAVASIDRERGAEESLKSPAFTWIDVVRGSQALMTREPPANWKPLDCFGQNQPTNFHSVKSLANAQSLVGYNVLTLPDAVLSPGGSTQKSLAGEPPTPAIVPTNGVTGPTASRYALGLADVGVLSCSKQPNDPDAKIKLRYNVGLLAERPASEGGATGAPVMQDTNSPTLSDIIMFQTRREPATLSVEGGQWKEVKVGEARGVYWSGSQYHDIEGQYWQSGANVLILEKGDIVVTLESRVSPESLLIALAGKLNWTGSPGSNAQGPTHEVPGSKPNVQK